MATPAVDSHALFHSVGDPLGPDLEALWLADEDALVRRLLDHPGASTPQADVVRRHAEPLLLAMRDAPAGLRIETLLQEYSLDTREGITLMCLAEALVRIPDRWTAERFLEDRLKDGDWSSHLGHSNTFWVNASTWGLLLAGKVCHPPAGIEGPADMLRSLVQRLSEPVLLAAVRQAMAVIGRQFIAGETITEAMANARQAARKGYCHSYDMLGEAALTDADTERYIAAYDAALEAMTRQENGERPDATLSIKLSAFHPRFEPRQPLALARLRHALMPILEKARRHDIPVTLDAEESWRLEPSLLLFRDLLALPAFRTWGGLGLAVQAYQKRALAVLRWLGALSRDLQVKIPVRLVKGAYWDSEIKWSQQQGLSDYPVFTRKESTDLHYQICAHYLLHDSHWLHPQFATHNAVTVGTILGIADTARGRSFEFQRLHGMGEALYDHLLLQRETAVSCRVYSPVGSFRELLPYLVRRLLENGANTSFVRHAGNHQEDDETLLQLPREALLQKTVLRHAAIAVPANLFGAQRENSEGIAIEARREREALVSAMAHWQHHVWQFGDAQTCHDPADPRRLTGTTPRHDTADCQEAMQRAASAFPEWAARPVDDRAALLDAIADRLEAHRPELCMLLMREAGKTLVNALGELREAVDFCRYYASQARSTLKGIDLPGPTGESNRLELHGRGVMLCISPWNFPLAIFTGQIVAALASGNCVIAKPSGQTSLIALRATDIMREAGIPEPVLHCLNAKAADIATVIDHPALGGVLFTGSNPVARELAIALASRHGPLLPLIAETGGQNAMIVDSSALPEQVIRDIAVSAFDSAGQRCSALRVVWLQEDIADTVLNGLKGHLAHLTPGDPLQIDTDIGPVISRDARDALEAHIDAFRAKGRLLFRGKQPATAMEGHFVSPAVIRLESMTELADEVFGPVLHVIRYKAGELDRIISEIRACGYGLTFGVHTRIESVWQRLAADIPAGNIYINRNMIGATVGVQPFGGQGLSGTGPKAGGPHYLQRLVHEKTVTRNTAASGGNADLLARLGE
jgi:RHH-type proline utilization regulon transcriptional repressor/proline dehydrogenase/delta 1-pyrroline-5-carboxylate dehydrogenase